MRYFSILCVVMTYSFNFLAMNNQGNGFTDTHKSGESARDQSWLLEAKYNELCRLYQLKIDLQLEYDRLCQENEALIQRCRWIYQVLCDQQALVVMQNNEIKDLRYVLSSRDEVQQTFHTNSNKKRWHRSGYSSD